jgi:hypothetical protein
MMDIKQQVQVKFSQYSMKYQAEFSRPEQKFFRAFSYGLLRSGQVHVTRIASSLEEKISRKKTCERLSHHLGKEDLGERAIRMHLSSNRRTFRKCRYIVVDGSDLSKAYAEKMEGLGRVHDGSTGELSNGYWLMNMIGVEPTYSSVHMLINRLYSFSKWEDPEISENGVILDMLKTLRESVGTHQIVVIDRGGDRRVLLEQFIGWKQAFIIRQRGDRLLHDGCKAVQLKQLTGRIKLDRTVEVEKIHGGRLIKRRFHCGALRVYLPHAHREGPHDHPLWLIRMRDTHGAESWYVCSLDTNDPDEAIGITLEGYGWRWRIEEVHRQIKQDYQLEKLSIRRYSALKNFMTLFWIVMNFIYQHLYDVSIRLILYCSEPLLYRGRFSEIRGFFYYKLTRAVRLLMLRMTYKGMHPTRKQIDSQLAMAFP